MNLRKDPRWAYIFVNLSCLLWASNFVLGRILRDDIGPLMLTTIRVAVGSVFYAAILGRFAVKERLLLRDCGFLAGMSLTGVIGFPLLLYWGLQFTTATNAALINATGPLVTAVLAGILLREQLLPRHILGGIISFFGVGLIASGGSFARFRGFHLNFGDLYVFFAVVLWGLYSVIGRRATQSRSVFSVTVISTWLALPILLGAAAVECKPATTNWSWHLLLALVYIGIFPSAVAFLSWNEGVRRVGPSRAMVFYNMLPVYGSMLGVFFLRESLELQHFAGGGLILVGSMIALWPELRTAERKE